MKSMNSGTPASVAPPERSSFGMIRSTSRRTVSHSWAVKCFGSYGAPRPRAARARAAASRTESGAQRNAAATGAMASIRTAERLSMSPPNAERGTRKSERGTDASRSDARNAVPRSAFRIPRSKFAPLEQLRDMLAGPQRQRQDGPRWILVGLRHERCTVGHEQVLTLVRLAPAVRHRCLGVVPHARPAQLMDDDAAGRDAVSPLGARHRGEHLAPHLGDERSKRLLHVLHLLVLVVRPLPVKPQHRNAPAVHRARVDLAVGVVVGNHLAAAREADRGAVIAAIVVLELLAVAAARRIALNPAHESVARHVRPAPDLDVVAAREVELLVLEPPRHVQMHPAHAVVVVRDVVHHLR